MNRKKEKLIGILGREHVYDDPETLEAYSREQSLALEMTPSFVVEPQNVHGGRRSFGDHVYKNESSLKAMLKSIKSMSWRRKSSGV